MDTSSTKAQFLHHCTADVLPCTHHNVACEDAPVFEDFTVKLHLLLINSIGQRLYSANGQTGPQISNTKSNGQKCCNSISQSADQDAWDKALPPPFCSSHPSSCCRPCTGQMICDQVHRAEDHIYHTKGHGHVTGVNAAACAAILQMG